MRISTVGIPGAGKTSLATTLGGIFKIMHISSGELARANGFANSDAEKTGQLDPDENKIRNLVKTAIGDSNTFILDGFPRTTDQIEALDIPLDAVLYLKVGDFNIAINRLLARARPDDTRETIHKRIETYFKHTFPLIKYFEDKGLLVPIDASGSMSETLGYAITALRDKNIPEVKDYVDKVIRYYSKTEV